MTIFDLLFLLLAFVFLSTLIAAAVAALRGRRARALTTLRTLGLCTIVYLAIVALVGFFSPQRILRVGDPWCFDDWCLSVERFSRTPVPPQVEYTVSLRLFSRARRVSQRARGAWLYLVDRQGHRYAPKPRSCRHPARCPTAARRLRYDGAYFQSSSGCRRSRPDKRPRGTVRFFPACSSSAMRPACSINARSYASSRIC